MEATQPTTNKQVVQNCYAYFGQGNIPALLNELTDDVKWFAPGPKNILPWVGVYNGKKGVAEFFKNVSESIEFLAFEPREFVAENDKVVAIGFLEGKSKKTGKVSKSTWAMAFTFKKGKIFNFEEFSDTHAAVEANK